MDPARGGLETVARNSHRGAARHRAGAVRLRWAGAVVLAAALTACATPEERIQAAQVELDRTCRGYGFKPGTDAYKLCWVQVDQAQRKASGGPINCQPVGSGFTCF